VNVLSDRIIDLIYLAYSCCSRDTT